MECEKVGRQFRNVQCCIFVKRKKTLQPRPKATKKRGRNLIRAEDTTSIAREAAVLPRTPPSAENAPSTSEDNCEIVAVVNESETPSNAEEVDALPSECAHDENESPIEEILHVDGEMSNVENATPSEHIADETPSASLVHDDSMQFEDVTLEALPVESTSIDDSSAVAEGEVEEGGVQLKSGEVVEEETTSSDEEERGANFVLNNVEENV